MYRRPPQANRELEALQEEMIDLRVRRVLLTEKLQAGPFEIEEVTRRLAEVERLIRQRSRNPYR